jgi:hypothetical protein
MCVHTVARPLSWRTPQSLRPERNRGTTLAAFTPSWELIHTHGSSLDLGGSPVTLPSERTGPEGPASAQNILHTSDNIIYTGGPIWKRDTNSGADSTIPGTVTRAAVTSLSLLPLDVMRRQVVLARVHEDYRGYAADGCVRSTVARLEPRVEHLPSGSGPEKLTAG